MCGCHDHNRLSHSLVAIGSFVLDYFRFICCYHHPSPSPSSIAIRDGCHQPSTIHNCYHHHSLTIAKFLFRGWYPGTTSTPFIADAIVDAMHDSSAVLLHHYRLSIVIATNPPSVIRRLLDFCSSAHRESLSMSLTSLTSLTFHHCRLNAANSPVISQVYDPFCR